MTPQGGSYYFNRGISFPPSSVRDGFSFCRIAALYTAKPSLSNASSYDIPRKELIISRARADEACRLRSIMEIVEGCIPVLWLKLIMVKSTPCRNNLSFVIFFMNFTPSLYLADTPTSASCIGVKASLQPAALWRNRYSGYFLCAPPDSPKKI